MNGYDLKAYYEEMEMTLIKSMRRNFSRHLTEEKKTGFTYPQWQAIKLAELKRYQRENEEIIKSYTDGLPESISKHIIDELKEGSISAINQYNKIHKNKKRTDKILNKSFFRTNDRKVKALIDSIDNDLKVANASALRMINDKYREIIHKSAFFVANGVYNEKQATEMAIREISEKKKTMLAVDETSKNFLAGGLNCIQYKDGKRVNIASYASMAVRTASLRAHLMGEGNFRKSIGETLVKVTTHGGACKLCRGWQGKILIDDVYSGGYPDGKHTLLSEAIEQGFMHPNCKHGITTYYPELENIENETEEEYQEDIDYINERINYINRNIKKYDRLSSGSIDKDNINYYINKKTQWENIKPIDYINLEDENVLKYKLNQYEKEIINLNHENAHIINKNGEVLSIDGDLSHINIPDWIDLNDSIITHNHPIKSTNYSLSEEDIMLFLKRNVKELRGIDDKYIYYAQRTKDTTFNIDNVKQDISKFRIELFEASDKGKIDIDRDGYDFINRKLSRKYRFKYSRRARK